MQGFKIKEVNITGEGFLFQAVIKIFLSHKWRFEHQAIESTDSHYSLRNLNWIEGL